jgi:HSP20 family protein
MDAKFKPTAANAWDNAAASLFFESSAEASPVPEQTEGELAVDVLETSEELIIVATIAGARVENIQLHLHNDFLTIRGHRDPPVSGAVDFFYQECFWGKFSRTIVLPVDVRPELATSEYRNGVLLIRLPKSRPAGAIPIMVIEE